jgi:aldehyde dehydrogenase (NAD+)/betaine-aldehyde dehydrogenase
MFSVARTAAALVAGNAVVVKPPETSALSVLILGEIAKEVLPRGVFNIVNGPGATVGDALVRHPDVKRIALIGSVPTGQAIQRNAAESGVKHVTLELGGKNPMIIFPDVDLDAAADSAVRGMNFDWQGQSCGSNSRVLIHEDIYEAVLDRIVQRVSAIRLGDPMLSSTGMGPINSKKSWDHVMSFLDPQQTAGARLMTGGKRPQSAEFAKGFWVEPTVYADVSPDMRLWKEEVFGPILSVSKWRDLDQVIAMANDTTFGLSAAIWTNDIKTALNTAKRLRVGSIFINGSNAHYIGVPWGGFKNSGVDREEGVEELRSYLETKVINILL